MFTGGRREGREGEEAYRGEGGRVASQGGLVS